MLPLFETFRDAESYYATLAHETTHWTAHESRLARDFGTKRFGSEGYAIEELVAELGAAFLCADLDLTLEPREDHAAYIANWLDVLKADNRAIFAAASHAQRAADFINGLQPSLRRLIRDRDIRGGNAPSRPERHRHGDPNLGSSTHRDLLRVVFLVTACGAFAEALDRRGILALAHRGVTHVRGKDCVHPDIGLVIVRMISFPARESGQRARMAVR